jgi:hypothetical protein
MHESNRQRPEPFGKGGCVLLGTTQLALLHGLYDRPNARAESAADWARAALPYSGIFRDDRCLSVLLSSAPRIHPAWVSREHGKHRICWSLTERGRGIVERTVPAWIRGCGPYYGLGHFQAIAGTDRPPGSKELIDRVLAGPWGDPIRRLIDSWMKLNRARNPNEHLIRQGRILSLRAFVCEYVMTHGSFPERIHALEGAAFCDYRFTVDFDEIGEWH